MRYLTIIATVWATTAPATDLLMDDALKVTIAQSGFAGITGTIYEVDLLANFTVSHFVNDQVTEEINDILPPEALATLQTLLNQPLKSSDASAPEINPRTITVNYQDQEWIVTMAPDATDQNLQGESVLNLAAWIAAQANLLD
jgi:hypothetical protein